jgi:succinoglycan biosynthesis protein ExoM
MKTQPHTAPLHPTAKALRTSYLVPTYKRPKELAVCLASILGQRGFDTAIDEVIVVDNCPEGSARALVSSFTHVRYEQETVPGVAAVRNRAFGLACGEWLVLLDDDQEATESLSEALRAGISKHAGDLGFAAIDAILEGETEGPRESWERLFARRWTDFEGELAPQRVPALSTGGVMVRRAAVLEVFGAGDPFDLSFGQTGGEDIAFFRAMRQANKRLLWLPSARIVERVPVSRLTRAFLLERRFSSGQLRTLLEGHKSPLRTARFMTMGAAQASVGFARYAFAKLSRSSASVAAEAEIVAGIGKVLFFGPFRKKRYGQKKKQG